MKFAEPRPIKDYCLGIFDGPHATPKESDDGPVFLGIKNITEDGALDLSEVRRVSEEEYPRWVRRVTPQPGDVVFTYEATLHRYAIIPEGFRGCLGRRVALVRPDPEQVDSRYLLYFFLSRSWRHVVESNVITGATVDRVPLEKFPSFLAALPKLQIQQRISGHEHTRINDGVPDGWERRPLSDLADVNAESLSSSFDGEIEYVDIASVTPGEITATATYDFRDAPSRARRLVRHGDVIWSCVRPNRRSYAVVWQPPAKLVVSTGFAVLSPRSVPTAFLYFATTTDAFVGYLENHARGAAYPAVVAGDFQRAALCVPSRSLLASFNDFVEPTLRQVHNLSMQNQELRAARDLLLPRLMSGAIPV